MYSHLTLQPQLQRHFFLAVYTKIIDWTETVCEYYFSNFASDSQMVISLDFDWTIQALAYVVIAALAVQYVSHCYSASVSK